MYDSVGIVKIRQFTHSKCKQKSFLFSDNITMNLQ